MAKARPSELPALGLGLIGFGRAQQDAWADAFAVTRSTARWRLTPLDKADALCVEGSHAQILRDGTIRVSPDPGSSRFMRFSHGGERRPMAFFGPTPAVKLAQAYETSSPENMKRALIWFAGCLQPLITQFHLAARIFESNLDLRAGTYHVSLRGHLIAIVSRRRGVGVLPMVSLHDLDNAVWSHRPEFAGSIPETFVRAEFAHVMWDYAMRTDRDCLPPHYRRTRLYLRRPPRLTPVMVDDGTLCLIRELGQAPDTFDGLTARTQLTDAELSRRLAALYMVGSITAHQERVPAAPPTALIQSKSIAGSATAYRPAAGSDLTIPLKRT